jgi:hypothetical protein
MATPETLNSISALSEHMGNLREFASVAIRCLRALQKYKTLHAANNREYFFFRAATQTSRPVRSDLFIRHPAGFARDARDLIGFLRDVRASYGLAAKQETFRRNARLFDGDRTIVDAVIYTIQQAFGCLSDVSGGAIGVRRYGTIFENLLHATLREAGLKTAKPNYYIPEAVYMTSRSLGRVEQIVKRPIQIDLVVARDGQPVRTTQNFICAEELFGSIKTSSKERIAQVFHDAAALQRQSVWRIHRTYLFLHNDVQRTKRGPGVASTFVFGGFLSGARTFPLDGIYFLDVPPNVRARLAGAKPPEESVADDEKTSEQDGDRTIEADAGEEFIDREATRKIGRFSDFLQREIWSAFV